MIINEYFDLSNGVKIPKLGFGTWQIKNEDAARCVVDAVSVGYIHIDTASAYRNEEGVGEGVKACGKKREEIFITSKVPAEVKSYEGAKKIIEESLKKLDTPYIDLMLIHAPKPWSEMAIHSPRHYYKENLEVWKALTEAYNDKKIRAIGVSNFEVKDLENIIKNSSIAPMVNQIRIHIGHNPAEVIEFCKENGILVEAYSPIATGRLLKNKEAINIANDYNVSVARLSVRYTYQLGTLPLPKTTHKEHMVEDADIDNFVISDYHMKKLDNI